MIFQQIRNKVSPGVSIPGTKYTVKGIGKRHGEEALVYRIPSRTSIARPSEKGITKSELEKAHRQLVSNGEFTRAWFNKNIESAAEAPCNFVAMGQLFCMLGIAGYKRGEFTLVV
jgi:hypothetical protein